MEDQILPVKAVDERNPIKDLEIDFTTVSKFFKLVVKAFPSDEAFRKAVESLVSIIHMQWTENH